MSKSKTFRHLRQDDRDRIEAMVDRGLEQQDIAKILDVSSSCICREINKRKKQDGRYSATRAEQKAAEQRRHSKYQGMKIENCPDLRKRIIAELEQKQSPDGIAGRLKAEKIEPRVSADAIYRWLHSVWGQRYCQYLCTKRYRRKKRSQAPKRHLIPNLTSIHDVLSPVGFLTEGDTFLSPKKASRTSGVLVVWQETKLLKGDLVKSLKPSHTTKVMKKIHREYRSDLLILDRGIENIEHQQFGVKTCFCDPASPRQKPLVESSVGLCRRWFWPKGTNLAKVSREEFQASLEILNNKYRKSLRYRSANEASRECGIMNY